MSFRGMPDLVSVRGRRQALKSAPRDGGTLWSAQSTIPVSFCQAPPPAGRCSAARQVGSIFTRLAQAAVQ